MREESMRRLIPAVLLGLVGVAPVAPAQNPAELPPAVITETAINAVTVHNERSVPVTIFLETGRFDRRLGVVPALDTKTLPLPAWAVEGRTTARVFARAEDDVADMVTEHFTLTPPGRFQMIVPNRTAMNAIMQGEPTDTMTAAIPPEHLANATLTVDNPRDVPVTVFAEAGMFAVRLGEVPAKSRATLHFPDRVVSPFSTVTIFVHPQGDFDLRSHVLSVRAGQHLGLRVPLKS
jgi:hypothetical protein